VAVSIKARLRVLRAEKEWSQDELAACVEAWRVCASARNNRGVGSPALAIAAAYSSSKTTLHSYSLSLRFKLKGSSVKVLELAPPWVRTD
jgi:NAD(P)-dependent dehydrogenase (short-subunit alcohol dehydrogenase family)